MLATACGLLGAGLVLLAVAVGTATPAWAHVLLLELFPLLTLVGVLLLLYELVLHRWLVQEIARIAGPGMVGNMLPQDVLRTFLDSIYGENAANHDVVSGVLGGEGVRPGGEGLTISTHTTVELEASAINHDTYHLTSTVSYSFKTPVADDKFVIFATCDPLLRDSIIAGCRLPLCDLWYVGDPDLFHESIEDMLPSVNIGMSYTDESGTPTTAELERIKPTDVKFERWTDYLTFFREPMSTMPRQNPRRHLNSLRIFECDLSGLASADHMVSTIERLTVQVTTLQPVDEGFLYWQSPYPCYVDRISLKATDLSTRDRVFEFRMMPFTFRSNTDSTRWLPAHELEDLDVQSWLLPGHGVVLVWRETRK
ncbi:hypothetical protein Lesp02_32910 [Lentzea sp. NBRC 105346]|uniref:hypothetical protein n=1 Tax=Lentzea sp. NBRC 105346 TaxID=3032205 RepID=UPI0024A47442|nr:hypothetical protein [Lentzea sp. NBRC 105346]GLZ31103.1 hypothetical protein Lesp02_32910 [Lentzea sp. NBRC 105346]